ncbi:hypothetical protein bsdtb5_07490 [Anaeromicropila herbilytica]|uniref:Uncharacterized protein n=1 Tax=Anaeromicropila herbilytica TaxID=2785025 RepID=A0A7R7EIP0_9FIRM|nr:hypothetical protein bsdtb5_07490 [Anaeromicropila herbilytica]
MPISKLFSILIPEINNNMSCPTNDLFQKLAWQFAQNRKSDCAFEYVLEDLVLGSFRVICSDRSV